MSIFAPASSHARVLRSKNIVRSLLLAGSAFGWLGCASMPTPMALGADSVSDDSSTTGMAEASVVQGASPSDPNGDLFSPAGPGNVFPSVEAAASDALVYSYLASRTLGEVGVVLRGGTIYPVTDGYSYDEPNLSNESVDDRLRYRLRSSDVAHYRLFPMNAGPDFVSMAGKLGPDDRRLVDRRDPLSRPLFYLTPKREMRVYLGAEAGERSLGQIAFSLVPDQGEVQFTRLALSIGPLPLATETSGRTGNAAPR